ncbi:BA3454 family stress response protein [Niallia oryzisoli]|uniref:BA3454 family stress response protein n=1 Tax=Niallia oryzisoli TaxID=1737571 RepID=A0ABZ2CMA9_9BACI
MYVYTIYVTLQGKIYQTNVIANKEQELEEIYQIAKQQVLKQWAS